MDFAFQPAGATGATPAASTLVAVSTSVQQLTLPSGTGKTMRLANDGTAKVAWSYGVSANLSMSNGVVMLPNSVESFYLPSGVTQISVIGSAAGSNLLASIGEGV